VSLLAGGRGAQRGLKLRDQHENQFLQAKRSVIIFGKEQEKQEKALKQRKLRSTEGRPEESHHPIGGDNPNRKGRLLAARNPGTLYRFGVQGGPRKNQEKRTSRHALGTFKENGHGGGKGGFVLCPQRQKETSGKVSYINQIGKSDPEGRGKGIYSSCRWCKKVGGKGGSDPIHATWVADFSKNLSSLTL